MSIRPATPQDAAEIVRLARLMYESMGVDGSEPIWQGEGERHVRERLGRDVAVLVADHPDVPGQLVASAAGTIAERLPGPRNPCGKAGYIQWVATEPAFRRRGLARAMIEALLTWYEAEGVSNVELHATPDGEPLYRSLGFDDGPPLAMRRQPA
jgi:GNAT superfamily N-acetyltransferase